MLVGEGADDFAKEMGVTMKTTDELVTEEAKEELRKFLEFKTSVNTAFVVRSEISG